MLSNALLFLLQAVINLLTLAFLLRFYFQLTRVSFQHQAAQAIVTLTNFAVKPVRKIVPSVAQLDLSTLLLAFVAQFILVIAKLWLADFPLFIADSHIWLIMLVLALLAVVSLSIWIFMLAMLAQAILSWVNPYTPIAPILNHLTQPILRLLRKFIPMAGNIDLTPLVFIITAQLLLTTILIPVESSLYAML